MRTCPASQTIAVRHRGRDRLEDFVTFMNVSLSAPVVRSADTTTGSLGVIGARFILDGGPSEGRFSLVEL